MSDMVERLTIVLGEQLASGFTSGKPVMLSKIVRVMLENMRDPTNEMLTAEEVHPSCHTCGGHLEGWHNMIDAALKAK
jgi:hypothetical protein